MKISKAASTFYLLTTFSLLLTGCGGGGSSSDDTDKTGTINARIADAPVDSAEAVVVHFTQATLHGPGGNTVIPLTDPATGNPGRSIDLLLFH